MVNDPSSPPLIDIDKIMRERKSKALQFFRPLIAGYVKKIVHQQEINEFLKKHHQDDIDQFIEAGLFEKLNLTYEVFHEELILPDPEKRYIYVSNHPIGGADGVMLIHLIKQKSGSVKTISNDLLLNLQNLREVFVGINLYGMKSRESVKKINEVFRSGAQIILFPAGLVSRRKKGVIKDLEWQPFFIKQAQKHKRDVIPVHVSGRLSNFFYNFANIRKALGIKPNIELFYLPNETFKQKNQHMKVTFGEAISWETFDNTRTNNEWAAELREFVYDLGAGKRIRYEPGLYDTKTNKPNH